MVTAWPFTLSPPTFHWKALPREGDNLKQLLHWSGSLSPTHFSHPVQGSGEAFPLPLG